MFDGIELGVFDFDSFMDEETNSEPEQTASIEVVERQIVFAIDASNSMQGHKIGAVNDIVNNVISKLESYGRTQPHSISISVVGYSSRLFRWTNAFVPTEDFKYSYVEMVDGLTDINALFQELFELAEQHMHLSAKKFVVLFSDGLPTSDYHEAQYKWATTDQYKDIYKIAVAFDDDLTDPQSAEFFRQFTDPGTVISVKEQEKLLSILLD
ncbi:MAG: VWA domain-containing protein [Eubacterium sp.]|nr:VWA domain-containing protein [Eubacterium sp.]